MKTATGEAWRGMDRGNWTDQPCYYVSVIDGPRHALLAGPFVTHREALDMVDAARRVAVEVDRKSWFYAFGTCRAETGHCDGILNRQLGILQ